MNLYVVRNKEGKFFRPVGQDGRGDSQWQTDLAKAKFYPKFGQAKSRVTFFAKHAPKFGVCDILEFTIDPSMGKVIDMEGSTNKVLMKAAIAREESMRREAEYEIQRLLAEKDAIEMRIKAAKISFL